MKTIEPKERERIEKEADNASKRNDGVKEYINGDYHEGFTDGAETEYLHLTNTVIQPLLQQLAEKDKEIENLKTVMIAAAEEIMRVWPAHCDEEGYGPANLMHRAALLKNEG